MDFRDDSRAFALADLDGDGRLEIVLKNRNAPQIRILRLAMERHRQCDRISSARHESNRDAIGAAVTVEAGNLRPDEISSGWFWILVAAHQGTFFWRSEEAANPSERQSDGRVVRTTNFENLPINHRIEVEEGCEIFRQSLSDDRP